MGFTKQDHKNYLRTVRQKKLKFGEACYLMEYFSKQMLENPSFFYQVPFGFTPWENNNIQRKYCETIHQHSLYYVIFITFISK